MIILDYPGEPKIITKILISERERQERVREGDVMIEEDIRVMSLLALEMECA